MPLALSYSIYFILALCFDVAINSTNNYTSKKVKNTHECVRV